MSTGPLLAGRWPRSVVRHQPAGRAAAELAALEVLERLDQLGLGVHHERAVVDNRLPDRPAAEDQYLQSGPARLLRRRGGDGDPVTGAQDHQLALLDRVCDRTDRSAPREDV